MIQIHPESLLRIPLVAQMMNDPIVKLSARQVDADWTISKTIPMKMGGFNPFALRIFYPALSPLAEWIPKSSLSARKLNEGDILLKQVLGAVHDYLHCWAVLVIQNLYPHLEFGYGPITPKTIENYAFCELLTEAVATVGMDYWFLSLGTLNETINLGTRCGPQTVDYHEKNLEEYQKFCPGLRVQDPKFFSRIAHFYCSGRFVGFDLNALGRSPMVLSWLQHELEYGEAQRKYARNWLTYLAPEQVTYDPVDLTRPVEISEKWQKNLISDMGQLLWSKVNEEVSISLKQKAELEDIWAAPCERRVDFRYINVNTGNLSQLEDLESLGSDGILFDFYYYQLVSRYKYRMFNYEELGLLELCRRARQLPLVKHILKRKKMLPTQNWEPRDLFLPN